MERKRKIDKIEGERNKTEEAEDDAEKMEKFFALIRSSREICYYMRRGFDELKEKRLEAAWNPSFKPEDFVHVEHSEAGPSTKTQDQEQEKQKKQEQEGDINDLDLNLSL